MATKKQLDEYGRNVVAAMSDAFHKRIDQVAMSSRISEVTKQAKFAGVDPNELMCYISSNRDRLVKELEASFPGVSFDTDYSPKR